MMANMAEFTPLFCKAISLLHSTSKSSTDQLKSLLDEWLALKTDKNVTIDSIKPTESKLKESQKRPAKPIPAVVKAKKSKSHSSPSSRNQSPEPKSKASPTQITPLAEESIVSIKKEEDSDATDIEDESTDAGEFALEMGLACVVCKQLDFAPGNQPVECSECHNLYHQECHKPPITDRDVSDPRNVWYCAKCTKNMEKASKKNARSNNKSPILTSSASFQSAVNSGRDSAIQLIKAKAANESLSSTSNSNIMQPFKRVEMKIPQSPGASGSGGNSNPTTPTKPVGLAGLAANLSRTTSSPSMPSSNSLSNSSSNKESSSSSSSSSIPTFNLSSSSSTSNSSSSSSPVTPSTHPSANLSKADKRIAQMKKKAANKKNLLASIK
ncbi:integrator complex subunit 12-like [Panonychus citri]|uniref:integrator complex subunit 12-like n=1 Tax=Panonychus citri TaxID=50023 RepID=UPI0023080EAC|nr:integrator complex subunit 12-like [Panonychus citri]